MTIASRCLVFLEHHIFDPMEAILNVPMLANALGKLGSIEPERTDVKHRFFVRLLGSGADPFHWHEPLHAHPLWVQTDHGV